MSEYRLYFLDRISARLERSIAIDAENDAAAVAMALEHEGPQSLELWTQGRRICRIQGKSEPQKRPRAAE